MELEFKVTKQLWMKVLQTSAIVMAFSCVTALLFSLGTEKGIVYDICNWVFSISWFCIMVSGIGCIWSKDSNKRSTLR